MATVRSITRRGSQKSCRCLQLGALTNPRGLERCDVGTSRSITTLAGVSPCSDCQTVLRTLQHRRITHPTGIQHEALQSRAALLRSSARPASDEDRRSAYEADLFAFEGSGGDGAPGLDVPSKQGVGRTAGCCWSRQPVGTSFRSSTTQPAASPDAGLGIQLPPETRSHLVGGLSCRRPRPICAISGTSSGRLLSCSKGCSSYNHGPGHRSSDALDSDPPTPCCRSGGCPPGKFFCSARDLARHHERQERTALA